ncbi:hypothetical protein SLE2022_079480 [Rubroshorea leprosula]
MASIYACLTVSPKFRPLTLKRPLSHMTFPGIHALAPVTFPRVFLKSPSSRASFPVIRASIDVSSAIRPGSVVESEKLPSDVRKRAMEAVDTCGWRVTIGDVASKAGLNLYEAQRALQALAADTDGFLEVSDEGDVLYVFPKDYRAKLASKSFRIKVEPLVEKTKAAAAHLVRVSFGTALVASIVIAFAAVVVILLSSKSGDSDDSSRRRGGRSNNIGATFNFSSTDLFWYWDPDFYMSRPSDRMNFIESVFSFVFGDGDPNRGIEEERWKLIGQYVASNGGVVTAEELAPYLDLETKKGVLSDESYILPVLLRFDGQPIIDKEGIILYQFPSLQRTASSQSGSNEYVVRRCNDWVGRVEKYFKEKKWQFSKTNDLERAMIIGLGAINLFGVILLTKMLQDFTISPNGLAGAFIELVAYMSPLLQIYAGSFFIIPLIRWIIIWKRNADIEKRNKSREQFAQALELPNPLLRGKLRSARDMAQKTVIGQDRIVYSTDRDLIEQDYEGREWERRFQEIKKSE